MSTNSAHSLHPVTPSRRPRPLRGIPTSRAYWELKAEQMMNRIFDPDATIDVPVEGEATPGPTLPPAPLPRPRALPPASRDRRQDQNVLLLSVLGGVCMISAVSSVLYLSHWNQVQQSLRQERNLLLVERLRELGPANPAPAAPAAPQLPAPAPLALQAPGASVAGLSGDDLPPPPEEPWIEQLSELPAPDRPAAPILRVPLSPRLAAATAPAAGAPAPAPAERSSPPRAAAAPLPLLVGVVGAAGRAGSAIFQVGSVSTSVGVGEAIGASGWRLRSIGADMAEIERGSEMRRVSITNGY